MMATRPRFRVDASQAAILVIVILAAVLRMGWPGLTEFKADEARLLRLALDMAEFKSFALRGIGSSVGFPNFPMSVWLFALPLLVWKHVYAATLFVGLLNTAAVYLCYLVVRRYWGAAAALTAALLFAVSPWAVIYSRKIWAQDLLPVFVLAWVATGLAAFVDKRRWALLAHIVVLSIIIQIHLSGIALILVTGIWMAVNWRASLAAWRELALGAAGAGLLALPFGYWLSQHMSGAAGVPGSVLTGPAAYDLDALRLAWLVWCGFDIHSLAGPAAFRDFLASIPNLDPVRWAWGALTLAGLAAAVRRRRPADIFLVLWLILPVGFFLRHTTPVFPHYFIITLPAAYVLAGQAVAESLAWLRSRGWQTGAAIVLGALALAQAAAWLSLLGFIGTHDTTGGFGTPLEALLSAADRADKAPGAQAGDQILIVGEGDDPSVSEFPAVMATLLRGRGVRYVDGRASALLPQGEAVVILQSAGLAAARRFYLMCNGCTTLPGEARGLPVVVLPAASAGRLHISHSFPPPRSLANGVELLGWETDPGWALVWRTGYVPAASDYHFFNHGPDAQADGVGFPSRSWQDGDTVISYFDLAAGGPVRVGMYEYPSVRNVPVLDPAGAPFSDGLTAAP